MHSDPLAMAFPFNVLMGRYALNQLPLASANGKRLLLKWALAQILFPVFFVNFFIEIRSNIFLNDKPKIIKFMYCLAKNISMSYLKLWIHCIWTTHNRIPYLNKDIINDVIFHILENAKLKGIFIDHLNGYKDHLHALISLGGSQTMSEVIQKIKGESSFWINKNQVTKNKFLWQDDYYAVSIGMPQLENLRKYIQGQNQHHQKFSIQDELDELIKEYDLKRFED